MIEMHYIALVNVELHLSFLRPVKRVDEILWQLLLPRWVINFSKYLV